MNKGDLSRCWGICLDGLVYLFPKTFSLFDFPIFWLRTYPRKVTTEMHRAHEIRYLRFITCSWYCLDHGKWLNSRVKYWFDMAIMVKNIKIKQNITLTEDKRLYTMTRRREYYLLINRKWPLIAETRLLGGWYNRGRIVHQQKYRHSNRLLRAT